MRKVALMTVLTLLLAAPVLAAPGEASPEQAQAWDRAVLAFYDGKYGDSKDYDSSNVTIADWKVIDVDASKLEAQAQEEIAESERELAELRNEVNDLQEQLDYFASLQDSMGDADYKEQIQPVVKDAEQQLDAAEKDMESLENNIRDLQDEEYFDQIAVSQAEIKFGGKVLGTVTFREDQFINPENGELIDMATAKSYDEVADYLDSQPQIEQQAFHHESVGLLLLALGVAGWLFVSRKF